MNTGMIEQRKAYGSLRENWRLILAYTLSGAAFGFCFPLVATLIICGSRSEVVSMGCLMLVHKSEPLLWMIDTAPLILGLLSLIAGKSQARVRMYAKSLKALVAEQTADLTRVRKHLENIIDTMAEFLVIMDRRGTITKVNVATVQVFGWEAAELTGKSAEMLFGRERLQDVLLSNPGDIFESGFLSRLDGEYTVRDGQLRYLGISVTYIWDEGMNIEGVVCAGRDITHQKQMETALIEARDNYENLFNSAPVPIVIARGKRLVYFNPEVERLLDYSAEELAEKALEDLVHPNDLQGVLRSQKTLENGGSLEGTNALRLITRKGKVRWTELQITPLRWQDEPAVLSFIVDTTERRIMLQALRESEEKFRELVQSLNVIIMKADPQFRFTFINRFGQEFFGFSESELLGRSIIGTITPEQESTGRDLAELVKKICEHPEGYHFNENENICRDGSRKWVMWSNYPVYSKQGELVEFMSTGYDVTERRKAEAVIREQQVKLEKAHRQTLVELEQARLAQLAALPGSLPEVPGVALAVKYSPMTQIGGDFYDLFLDAGKRLGILVGDVTGHGIPAALLSFMFLASFKNNSSLQASPDSIIARSNHFLCGKLPPGKYATVYYCVYDPENRVLHYSSAGHPPGFLLRNGMDKPQLLQTSGTVVGMFEKPVMPFQSRSVSLQPGDKIIIYTDGVMEVSDAEGRMMNPDAFELYLASRKTMPIGPLLEEIHAHCSAFSGPGGFNDDVTIIGMEVT